MSRFGLRSHSSLSRRARRRATRTAHSRSAVSCRRDRATGSTTRTCARSAHSCHGQALIAMGEPDAGVARLDDVMVSVTADELGPIATGIVYCGVILECMELYDCAGPSEWTECAQRMVRFATRAWCRSAGQCLVHRSQLRAGRRATGRRQSRAHRTHAGPLPIRRTRAWPGGLPRKRVARLRGIRPRRRLPKASARHDPIPGWRCCSCARGDSAAAAADDRRAVTGVPRLGRSRPALLAGAVEIFRATGDFAAARATAEELSAIAARSTLGSVLHGDGRPGDRIGVARGRRRDGRTGRVAGPPARTWQTLRHAVRRGEGRGAAGVWRARRWATGSAPRWNSTLPEIFSPNWARAPTWTRVSVRCRRALRVTSTRTSRALSAREQRGAGYTWQRAGRNRRNRRTAGRQPAHGRPPRRTHLRQAGGHQPHGGHRVRVRAPSGLSHGSFDLSAQNGSFGRCALGVERSYRLAMSSVSYQHFTGTRGRKLPARLRASHRHTGLADLLLSGRPDSRANESSTSRAARA